jgi:dsRNA-specific ribonuclease
MVGATQEMDPSKIAFGMDGLKAPKQLADLVESIACAILVDSGFDTQVVWDVLKPLLLPIATPETLVVHPVSELQELCTTKGYHMNVTTINKTNVNNGDIPNEVEHRYEVQLPGGVVVEGTSTNTLPKKMAQMDAAQKVLAKLQALGYRTKHCVKEIRKWELFQQSTKVEGDTIFPHEHQLNHDGAAETVEVKS